LAHKVPLDPPSPPDPAFAPVALRTKGPEARDRVHASFWRLAVKRSAQIGAAKAIQRLVRGHLGRLRALAAKVKAEEARRANDRTRLRKLRREATKLNKARAAQVQEEKAERLRGAAEATAQRLDELAAARAQQLAAARDKARRGRLERSKRGAAEIRQLLQCSHRDPPVRGTQSSLSPVRLGIVSDLRVDLSTSNFGMRRVAGCIGLHVGLGQSERVLRRTYSHHMRCQVPHVNRRASHLAC
jgi:rRNA maturation endonuclease Nob1